jgi:hypothetical protein
MPKSNSGKIRAYKSMAGKFDKKNIDSLSIRNGKKRSVAEQNRVSSRLSYGNRNS